MNAPAPLLVLGVGNPSRGDDALGPLFIDRLGRALVSEVSSGAVELLTDFQLQIEHALDLEGRKRVVFVDASTSATPPFEFTPVVAAPDTSCTTHALSPSAVLATRRHLGGEPPESFLLAIRGERFELGDPLTARAEAHLTAALAFFLAGGRGNAGERLGRRFEIEGTVQGIGFRPWVYRVAQRLGLGGAVYNTPRGVAIEAFGSGKALDALLAAIQGDAPRGARVRMLELSDLPARDVREFSIAPSVTGGTSELSLPPDLATCEACLAEVRDLSSRYFGYAFTSCMHCGPRLAVAAALPYDRATTTMAPFVRCEACQRAYDDPMNRRFHAETAACARCGPRLWLADVHGSELTGEDPIQSAVALLRDGNIVAVQGIGAFHLACDARSVEAVARLRERKRRDAQPFAVMVRDLAEAERISLLNEPLRAALLDPARPIVLAPARPDALASGVNGPSRRTGLMLPYTPLHHLLLDHFGGPLVMTSANVSGAPAIIDAVEAMPRLDRIADAFLLHDRVIARRVEDSVVSEAAHGVRVVRRSRGFAPIPIELPAAAPEPVLAVGGHLKNTACVVIGDRAYLTPHFGDLELYDSEQAFRRDLESFERLLGVGCDVVAHDLHPDYVSTRVALERKARRHVGVQHHVAHVLAAVAELGLTEPVVGVVFDGSGFGTDGTSWGGEILVVDGQRWTRAQSYGALALPGGERGVREVWRVAFSALVQAFGRDEALALTRRLPVFAGVEPAAFVTLSRMIESAAGTVAARGVGRWYDAAGALALGMARASFEAHVAIRLEEAADGEHVNPYPVGLPSVVGRGEPIDARHEIDLGPTIRALVVDVLAGVSPARVAARFQATLVEATATRVLAVLDATGLRRVVLSGGCFQNRALELGLRARLGAAIVMARDVPVNDGGLALGQAWAAVLALRAEAGEE